MKVRYIQTPLEAKRFTIDAATHYVGFEKWTGGSLKGTALPPSERIIEVWCAGEEYTGCVGDWFVKGATGVRPHTDAAFKELFEEVK
jgi:hypothetical protein